MDSPFDVPLHPTQEQIELALRIPGNSGSIYQMAGNAIANALRTEGWTGKMREGCIRDRYAFLLSAVCRAAGHLEVDHPAAHILKTAVEQLPALDGDREPPFTETQAESRALLGSALYGDPAAIPPDTLMESVVEDLALRIETEVLTQFGSNEKSRKLAGLPVLRLIESLLSGYPEADAARPHEPTPPIPPSPPATGDDALIVGPPYPVDPSH